MVTELERAIWEAAGPLRSTRFSQILRNSRMSERDPALPGPDDRALHLGTSFQPAVHRAFATEAAIATMDRSRQGPPSEWLEWNMAAKRAMTRVSAKCWAGIDADRRAVFIDEDNLDPVLGMTTFFDLRSDTPGRHLDFEGLAEPGVADALKRIFRAARATPAYSAARRADRCLGASPRLLLRWAQLAEKGHLELRSSNGRTVDQARRHGRELVRTLYGGSSVQAIAESFRSYNRLVQHIVWCILGIAEDALDPPVVTNSIGTVQCSSDRDGYPQIHLTTVGDQVVFPQPTYPLWLQLGTPLDGLHVVMGYAMNWNPATISCDLTITPLRASAKAWPN